MRKRIPFGEWLPDLPPLSNPGALTARNVIAEASSYRSLRSLQAYSQALASPALGVFWAQDASNTVYNFAGTATGLYRQLATGAWEDVTRTVGGAYTSTGWEFAKFGQRIIAVNQGDAPQYYDMGTSTDFEDLPGSPPQASRVAVVRDFIMLGDLQNAGDTVHWGGFNASELWTPSLATMSDSQQLFGRGGRVQRIVPGDVAVIFREHSIHLMQPVGPPLLFDNREVEPARGTPAPNSVIWSGNLIFYYGHDGFYRFDVGSGSTPIGHNRVNRWFEANANAGAVVNMRGAIDRRNRLAMWSFACASGGNDCLLIYNWGADRWSYGTVTTQLLADLASSGYTLDTLDSILPGGIDATNLLVDSPDYQGGVVNFVAFDSSNRLSTFSGAALAAEVDTGEFSDATFNEPAEGQRVLVTNVRPLVDGTSPTVGVRIGPRDRQDEVAAFDTAVLLNESGDANVFRDARYHRVRVEVSGEFSHIQGVDVEAKLTGRY